MTDSKTNKTETASKNMLMTVTSSFGSWKTSSHTGIVVTQLSSFKKKMIPLKLPVTTCDQTRHRFPNLNLSI